jgi:hypothetical protein
VPKSLARHVQSHMTLGDIIEGKKWGAKIVRTFLACQDMICERVVDEWTGRKHKLESSSLLRCAVVDHKTL